MKEEAADRPTVTSVCWPLPEVDTPEPGLRVRLSRAARAYLPLRLQNLIRSLRGVSGVHAYARDCWRFLKYSGVRSQMEGGRLRARITAQYHVIEKGLSHHAPRLGFGKDAVLRLVSSLQAYAEAGYTPNCSQFQSAIAVLEQYREFHRLHDAPVPEQVDQLLNSLAKLRERKFSGGYRVKLREDLLAHWRGDFYALATHRHSIRHFSGASVSDEAILKAVDLARTAPSACNRQSVKVHVLRDKQKIREVLELQGGARGFAALIEALLVITADLRGYTDCAERHLAYVDGGLFAMTLIYALCYEGIASCPLHLALTSNREKRLRQIAALPNEEATVVMLGIGHLPDQLKVANSQRKPVEEYIRFAESRVTKTQ